MIVGYQNARRRRHMTSSTFARALVSAWFAIYPLVCAVRKPAERDE